MKILVFALFGFLTLHSQAQTLEQFLAFDDEQKIEFLNNKAELFEDEKSLQEFESTHAALYEVTKKSAQRTSDVWWDTILEGPYALVGDKATFELSGIYLFNGEVYGICGTVSQDALMIDSNDCVYNEETDKHEGECYEGVISEFIYFDGLGNFIESDHYADFYDN